MQPPRAYAAHGFGGGQGIGLATASTDRPPALRSIQAARGLAALFVAAFHLSIMFGTDQFGAQPTFAGLTWWGFRGVDFFFVLSGFILMLAHGRDIGRPDRLGRYAWNRATRVYPAYWLYTLFVVGLNLAVGGGEMLGLFDGPLSVATIVTLVRLDDTVPPLAIAWTLFHEILFYAVFAVLIANRRAGILLFALWGAAILAARLYPTPHTPEGVLVGAYNVNFFVGLAAFWAFGRIGPRAAGIAFFAAFPLFGAMLWLEAAGQGGFLVHLGYALAFGLAILGAAVLERAGRLMTLPGLDALGDASYSLYLTHATMQAYMAVVLVRLGLFDLFPRPLLWLGLLAGTVVIALVAYRFVEKPINRYTRALRQRSENKRKIPA